MTKKETYTATASARKPIGELTIGITFGLGIKIFIAYLFGRRKIVSNIYPEDLTVNKDER